eukprot:TRINITY_DN24049_c0_g1_i2.p1 TRINITY_DN24049_c0_g1~~TRINITY_DN24049_c0_g1_i2.p1  ORF type:complete len:160 (+),score=41.48 TRINITY_DN24049_c0_g1_i2:147-626(+)
MQPTALLIHDAPTFLAQGAALAVLEDFTFHMHGELHFLCSSEDGKSDPNHEEILVHFTDAAHASQFTQQWPKLVECLSLLSELVDEHGAGSPGMLPLELRKGDEGVLEHIEEVLLVDEALEQEACPHCGQPCCEPIPARRHAEFEQRKAKSDAEEQPVH